MTELTSTLDKLKILLGISGADEDTLLLMLLDLSTHKILERLYPFHPDNTVLPSRYEGKQIEIAAYLYNKRGAEGQTSHNENGINRTYESADVPASLLRGIAPFVGAPLTQALEPEGDVE